MCIKIFSYLLIDSHGIICDDPILFSTNLQEPLNKSKCNEISEIISCYTGLNMSEGFHDSQGLRRGEGDLYTSQSVEEIDLCIRSANHNEMCGEYSMSATLQRVQERRMKKTYHIRTKTVKETSDKER